MQRKITNRTVNQTRDAQVKAGIQALKSGQIRATDGLGLVDVDGKTIAPEHPPNSQLAREHSRMRQEKSSSGAERAPGVSALQERGVMPLPLPLPPPPPPAPEGSYPTVAAGDMTAVGLGVAIGGSAAPLTQPIGAETGFREEGQASS